MLLIVHSLETPTPERTEPAEPHCFYNRSGSSCVERVPKRPPGRKSGDSPRVPYGSLCVSEKWLSCTEQCKRLSNEMNALWVSNRQTPG